MHSRLIAALICLFILAAPHARAAEAQFIEGLADVPLMPGLRVVEDAGLRFDNPGGRIVEIIAVGKVSAKAVAEFYASTLPQLGWRGKDNEYWREGERLRIQTGMADGKLAVRFFLAPAR